MELPSAIMIKVPERFGAKEARKLRRELKTKIASERPCVVVDLSRVQNIDLAGLEGLLDCMEEIAKYDGALELGGISPAAATVLELARMDQLFQKFPAFEAEAPSFALVPEPIARTEEGEAQPAVQPQPLAA